MSNDFWIQNAEEFLSFEHPSERDVLHPAIISKVNSLSPKRYLDFGAGDGRMSLKLDSKIPIDIFDISQIMIDNAKKNLGKRLNNAFTSFEKIPKNYYDVVVCSMVLICINNKRDFISVLSSISNSLKPNGKAIFSITHPCFRANAFSDFYTEFTLGKTFDYFLEGQPFNVTIHNQENTDKITFEDYHWSFSFTINKLIESNLRIVEIQETQDDKGILGFNKNVSPFLIIITEKNEN